MVYNTSRMDFLCLAKYQDPSKKNMAKVLLGCLVGVVTKEGIKAVRALLDFIYITQYKSHDDQTLGYLQGTLDKFQKHKKFFINVGLCKDLNIPKFHMILH